MLVLTLAAAACAAESGLPHPRQQLNHETLMQGRIPDAPVDMNAFAAPAGAPVPPQVFSGRLSFAATGRDTRAQVLRDTSGMTQAGGRRLLQLPAFDFEFVQSADAIIPLRRGSLPGDNRHWEYMLEPGRVWQETGDRGLARAAIPFALQERNANCMHYGMLTFLFGAEGTVSRVAFQISSETCEYLQFDLWGSAKARYLPGTPADSARIIRDYESELRSRLPVRSFAMLGVDHAGADPEGFGATDEVAPGDMTAYGFVINGVHYAGSCATRHGPYPFCDVLPLPSYSLAKSIFAGVALMRLQQRFPGAVGQRIADFVPECRRAGHWDDVTFQDALDFTTGNYRSPKPFADEYSDDVLEFFIAGTHAAKIRHACAMPRQEPPGRRWVYHTSDTYVLGTALNAFVKQRLGATKDVYTDVVVPDLWRPLGLSPVTAITRRTNDAIAQPFTGWGLALHRDDIARIAHWLATGNGAIDGRQLLDPRMLAAALQRVPDDRGLPSIDASFRYQYGFHAHDVSSYIGCADPVWVPYMTGHGGIVVALFPNDTIYYYFSDGGSFRWRRAAIEADRIRAFCGRRHGTEVKS